MRSIHRPGPARAALLALTALLIACSGAPTANTPDSGSSNKKSPKPATPKPTGSGSPSATTSPGGSPGASATPTASPSASPSASPTAKASSSASPAASNSPAASSSPSSSPSGSPAPSASPSGAEVTPPPNPTASATPGPTPAPGSAVVDTYAGSGTAGFDAGASPVPLLTAKFKSPEGLAVGPDGAIYVADTGNHAIRKIKDGNVTTLIGTGSTTTPDDPVTLNGPKGLAVDADGTIYIADTGNHRIRKLAPGAAQLTLVAGSTKSWGDGQGAAAKFDTPTGLALDGSGGLWVTDTKNHVVRRINLANGDVTTVAGKQGLPGGDDGNGEVARFFDPTYCFAQGGNLYVADFSNDAIRLVTPTGLATTPVQDKALFGPVALHVALDGSMTIANFTDRHITRISGTGTATNLIAPHSPGFKDGTAAEALFESYGAMVVAPSGALLICDPPNHRIRRIR